MDSAPPPYDDIENGNSQYRIDAAQQVPTAPPIHCYTPDPIFQYRSAGPNLESIAPPIRQQYRPAADANSVYTINAAAQVHRQQPGNSNVYVTQGQPVYIIPKAAVDRAVQDAQFRRNCFCWFFAIKFVVIIIVIIIIVGATS